ncbi:hypothetical protein B0H10DRAFT_1977441 [Mycena sp. CBHHK59/15]|nr:hypothetical protein B0H10DRAFT_1977441 [Mycena sp. CBHHK59/15]
MRKWSQRIKMAKLNQKTLWETHKNDHEKSKSVHLLDFNETSKEARRAMEQKEESGIPRRHKPVVQQQGHRVPVLQAEHEDKGGKN